MKGRKGKEESSVNESIKVVEAEKKGKNVAKPRIQTAEGWKRSQLKNRQ